MIAVCVTRYQVSQRPAGQVGGAHAVSEVADAQPAQRFQPDRRVQGIAF